MSSSLIDDNLQQCFSVMASWPLSVAPAGFTAKQWEEEVSFPDPFTFGLRLGDEDRTESPRKGVAEYFRRHYDDLWTIAGVSSPFAETQFGDCQFDLMRFDAPLSTHPLDNPPRSEPYITSLSEAFETLQSFWASEKSKGLVPLDWGAFVRLLSTRAYGEEHFLSLLDRQYAKYNKITLVFADNVFGGCNKERLYLVWYLIRRKTGGIDCGFKFYRHDFLYHLDRGETFIVACIPRDAVEFPETKKSPELFTKREPLPKPSRAAESGYFLKALQGLGGEVPGICAKGQEPR